MKLCNTCQRGYTDDAIKFCLDDGTVLQSADIAQTGYGVAVAAAAGGSGLGFDATIAPDSTMNEHGTDVQIRRTTSEDLPAGTRVGEYIIDKKIGEGGMGMIFSATHPVIGKQVAIKVLNPAMANNPDVVARFVQEAKSVNQIRNRNIVDIFSFGNLPDGRHYFAMELLEGESLADRLRQKSVEWPEATQIWIQVATAIEAAHRNDIVHRDLKPDNVFLSPSAEGPFVKVLDFGIAKLLGDNPTGMTKTSTGMPIGTPTYMAPEQAMGAKVDHRTDLYAFGIILFETIAGRPPFTGDTVIHLLHQHMNEPAPSLDTVVQKVDPELRTLVARMLEKEPDARPKSMTEVREELQRLRDLAQADRKPLYGEALATPIVRPKRTKKKTSSGTIVAVAALGLAIAGMGAIKLTERTASVAPVAVAPAPVAAPVVAPAGPQKPKPGRLLLSTNTPSTKVFLDRSETDRATEPAAAGGNNLRLAVEPNVSFVLRIEAAGFQTMTMPLRISEGEEQAMPVVLTPDAPVVKKGHGGGKATVPAPAAAAAPAAPAKVKPTENGKFLDPFAN